MLNTVCVFSEKNNFRSLDCGMSQIHPETLKKTSLFLTIDTPC